MVKENEAEENMPIVEILKTYKFCVLYLLVICHMYSGYYISNQFK